MITLGQRLEVSEAPQPYMYTNIHLFTLCFYYTLKTTITHLIAIIISNLINRGGHREDQVTLDDLDHTGTPMQYTNAQA